MQDFIRKAPRLPGFSLVEVALVLAVLGLVGGGLFHLLGQWKQSAQCRVTKQHEEKILWALGRFLKKNGYLPPPADPVDLVNWGKSRQWVYAPEECYGIIPFRTLGLSESVAKNGGGIFFTYVVHRLMLEKHGPLSTAATVYRLNTEALQKRGQDVQYKYDFKIVRHAQLEKRTQEEQSERPYVMALWGHLYTAEGSFSKGGRRRRAHKKMTPLLRRALRHDFWLVTGCAPSPKAWQETLRVETTEGLAYYAQGLPDSLKNVP